MKELKRYFTYMGKNLYLYWGILIATLVIESTLQILYSYINKQTLNAVEYVDTQLFGQAAVLCAIVVVLKCLFPYLRYFMIKLVRKMVFELKIALFQKLMRLDMNFYEKSHSADGIKTLNWDANSLKDSWFSHVYWVLGKITLGISALIAMLLYSPLLAGIAFLVCIFTGFMTVWLNQTMRKNAQTVQNGAVRLAGKLSDLLAGFIVLKIYAGSGIVTDRFFEENQSVTRQEIVRVKKAALLEMLSFLLGITGSFGTILAGTYLAARGQLDYGTVMAVVTLQISLSSTMQRLGSSVATFTNSLVKAGRVFDFLELACEEKWNYGEGETNKADAAGNEKNSHEEAVVKASIKIKNITFGYEAQKNIYEDWSIDIKPQEKLMIKGKSGGGKSTLLKLLLRFYDVQAGSIEINGTDIRQLSIRELRKLITYIPQECYLFEGTIAENIAFGSETAVANMTDAIAVTGEEVVSSARLAYADEFIEKFADGYHTQVAEGGRNLSGGQRQRIAIARAFLKNSPILFMDEPSSALDEESRDMIHEALKKLMKGKLVIMVTHTEEWEKDFDRVVMINR